MDLDLSGFECISLDDMGDIRLMKRMDTKYIVPVTFLPEILRNIQTDYLVQEISGKRIFKYATLYYDTPEYTMYHAHQNGKLNRLKIRTREYVDSDLCFLEVKKKSNKGVTKKVRIANDRLDSIIRDEALQFLDTHSPYSASSLEMKLNTFYNRITLTNHKKTERVTIDFDLQFDNICTKEQAYLSEVGIIEVKKDRHMSSLIESYFSDVKIRSVSISKYCVGIALTDSWVKRNRFKCKMRKINKLSDIAIYG